MDSAYTWNSVYVSIYSIYFFLLIRKFRGDSQTDPVSPTHLQTLESDDSIGEQYTTRWKNKTSVQCTVVVGSNIK